ncbi:hypothetical protein [Streptomyces catenulae]|uniref:Uncharacterized protein n=1 Tax=Streptomyces catenulae TaxID=66875 RepID=A0ABV2YTH2_9ACTN|nr:hypothetical protein [Streptomyces catenulae]
MKAARSSLPVALFAVAGVGLAHLVQNIRHDRARVAVALEKFRLDIAVDFTLDADLDHEGQEVYSEMRVHLLSVTYRTRQISRAALYTVAHEEMIRDKHLARHWPAIHPRLEATAADRATRTVLDAFHAAYEAHQARQHTAAPVAGTDDPHHEAAA